jgi:hypothetical protein
MAENERGLLGRIPERGCQSGTMSENHRTIGEKTGTSRGWLHGFKGTTGKAKNRRIAAVVEVGRDPKPELQERTKRED